MLNKLMTALVTQHSEQGEKQKPQQMVNIKFKYRKLGVNAQANNYAFANDCYSQWTAVSPNFITQQVSENRDGPVLSISQAKMKNWRISRP